MFIDILFKKKGLSSFHSTLHFVPSLTLSSKHFMDKLCNIMNFIMLIIPALQFEIKCTPKRLFCAKGGAAFVFNIFTTLFRLYFLW